MARGKIPEAEDQDPRYFSRAVAKALFMLDLLNASGTPLGLNEIARETQLTKTSAFRLLHTLVNLRFVEQQEQGLYRIGARGEAQPAMRLANVLRSADLKPAKELLTLYNETVNLAALFENHIEVVRVFESTRVLRMSNTVGRILSPHASSLGKAITAFQPEQVRQQLLVSYGLTRFTANTITEENALVEEFKAIRQRGYSTEKEESTPEGCCVGAPIRNLDARVVAGISVSIPKSRMPRGKQLETMSKHLLDAASAISEILPRELRDPSA